MSGSRVRILSDLHLGHPGSLVHDVQELRPLLEGVDVVVFNGDSCELAYTQWQEGGKQWFDDLKALCAGAGVRPVFLTGNHDPGISEQGWLDLLGGAVFVTHGDMVDWRVAPWSREYLARKRKVAAVWAGHGGQSDDLAARWKATRAVEEVLHTRMRPKLKLRGKWQLLSAGWPPERALAILMAWATMFPAARDFLRRYRPEARVMIFGHFHHPGVAWRDGCLLVNTGAFMGGLAIRVVDVDGGRLTVRRVSRNAGGGFEPGEVTEVYQVG